MPVGYCALVYYTEVPGMTLETFREGKRLALKFGKQKINIHVKGREYEPKAHAPGVGTPLVS